MGKGSSLKPEKKKPVTRISYRFRFFCHNTDRKMA